MNGPTIRYKIRSYFVHVSIYCENFKREKLTICLKQNAKSSWLGAKNNENIVN